MRRVALVGLIACACGKPAAAPPTPGRPAELPIAVPIDAGSDRSGAFPTKPSALPSEPKERRCAIATYDHEVRAPVAQGTPSMIAALPLGKCFASANGAWSLSIEIDETMPSRAGNVGGFVVVHVDANDNIVRRVTGVMRSLDDQKKTAANFAAFVWDGDGGSSGVQTFDFDGNGDLEIYVEWLTAIGSARENAESWTDGELLTFADGKVVPYAPSAKLSLWGLEDVDKDGRPDIRTSSPYGGRLRKGQSPDYVWGPPLVAHSLPDGTFSMTDAVATSAARQVCPEKLTPALLAKAVKRSDRVAVDEDPWGRPSEETTSVELAGCARLWGIPVDAIRKAYAGHGALSPDLERVLRVEPPLTLK